MDVLNIILQNTYTLPQLHHKLRILKSHLMSSFFASENPQTVEATDTIWLNSLPSNVYQIFTKDNLVNVFKEIENNIIKLPNLTIFLPFSWDDLVVQELGSFVRKQFGSLLILEVKYDPKLIAGCALVWKGIYKDYSLKAKIEEKKDEILANFKKFPK